MAARKKVEAKVDAAPEPEVKQELIPFESLSPELKAIYEEAEAIEAKAMAELHAKNAKITANILAHYRIVKKTGRNADQIMERIQKLSAAEQEGADSVEITPLADAVFEVVEAIVGKHLAKTFLEELEGEKISFVPVFKDVITLGSVGKA